MRKLITILSLCFCLSASGNQYYVMISPYGGVPTPTGRIWTGSTSADISLATNWNPSAALSSTDTLNFTDSGTYTNLTGNGTSGSTWVFNSTHATKDYNLAGCFLGTSSVTKAGTSICNIPINASNYTGVTVVNAGTLILTSDGSNPTFQGGNNFINGASTLKIAYSSGGNQMWMTGTGKLFTFDSVGGGTLDTTGINWVCHGLTFQTLGGARDTISGGGINCDSGYYQTFQVASGSDASIDLDVSSGPVSNSGGIHKTGNGRLRLSYGGNDTYAGTTYIDAGTLILGASTRLSSTALLSISNAATFDCSAIAYLTNSASTAVTAYGTGTSVGTSAAAIAAGTIIDFGSSTVTLAYDGSHPALYISTGTLSLHSNAFVVNGTALADGTYNIVTQASGSITSSGSYSVSGTAIGARSGSVAVSGANVVLTITG